MAKPCPANLTTERLISNRAIGAGSSLVSLRSARQRRSSRLPLLHSQVRRAMNREGLIPLATRHAGLCRCCPLAGQKKPQPLRPRSPFNRQKKKKKKKENKINQPILAPSASTAVPTASSASAPVQHSSKWLSPGRGRRPAPPARLACAVQPLTSPIATVSLPSTRTLAHLRRGRRRQLKRRGRWSRCPAICTPGIDGATLAGAGHQPGSRSRAEQRAQQAPPRLIHAPPNSVAGAGGKGRSGQAWVSSTLPHDRAGAGHRGGAVAQGNRLWLPALLPRRGLRGCSAHFAPVDGLPVRLQAWCSIHSTQSIRDDRLALFGFVARHET